MYFLEHWSVHLDKNKFKDTNTSRRMAYIYESIVLAVEIQLCHVTREEKHRRKTKGNLSTTTTTVSDSDCTRIKIAS